MVGKNRFFIAEEDLGIILEERLRIIQDAVESKKGLKPVTLNLQGISSELDAFFICHGTSSRHVRAIAEGIQEMLIEIGEKPLFIEGLNEANWVLMDCGDVGIHIFEEKTREYYRLEDLWSHAPLIDVAAPSSASGSIS
ncbi:MAG TPA: ribosome silencing factor [Nitrospinae bacterium]|nr:ribosome silencing factor [Nitrospinota bacterium]